MKSIIDILLESQKRYNGIIEGFPNYGIGKASTVMSEPPRIDSSLPVVLIKLSSWYRPESTLRDSEFTRKPLALTDYDSAQVRSLLARDDIIELDWFRIDNKRNTVTNGIKKAGYMVGAVPLASSNILFYDDMLETGASLTDAIAHLLANSRGARHNVVGGVINSKNGISAFPTSYIDLDDFFSDNNLLQAIGVALKSHGEEITQDAIVDFISDRFSKSAGKLISHITEAELNFASITGNGVNKIDYSFKVSNFVRDYLTHGSVSNRFILTDENLAINPWIKNTNELEALYNQQAENLARNNLLTSYGKSSSRFH